MTEPLPVCAHCGAALTIEPDGSWERHWIAGYWFCTPSPERIALDAEFAAEIENEENEEDEKNEGLNND